MKYLILLLCLALTGCQCVQCGFVKDTKREIDREKRISLKFWGEVTDITKRELSYAKDFKEDFKREVDREIRTPRGIMADIKAFLCCNKNEY